MTPLLRHPTLRGSRLVFVSDDSLWSVSLEGGRAIRLFAGHTPAGSPVLSRDGRRVAFVTREEGAPDLYVMDADGGPIVRRSWWGVPLVPLCFDAGDTDVVVAHGAHRPFPQETHLHRVPVDTGCPSPLRLGPALGFDVGPGGERVLCRHTRDLAHWKRYRGGRVGQLWVDTRGDGSFEPIPSLGGNVACPRWYDDGGALRLLFVSDHEGVANLYSVRPDGTDLRRHTAYPDRAVRFPSVDGSTVVYEHAGNLYRLDLGSGDTARIPIALRTHHRRAHRRHVPAANRLEEVALHPQGHSLALTVRGRTFVGGAFEGPMVQIGARDGARQRLVRFTAEGDQLVWVSDAGGEEHLELADLDSLQVLPLDLDENHGRIVALVPGPGGRIAIADDQGRAGVVRFDLDDSDGLIRDAQLIWLNPPSDRGAPFDFCWSPDGSWLAFAAPTGRGRSRLRLADLRALPEVAIHDLTDGRYADRSPSFDPAGRWIAFVGQRIFEPVANRPVFGYGFPKGSKPYLITLQRDLPSPFEPVPHPLGKLRPPKPPERFTVDTDGIRDRIVPVPVAEAPWSKVVCLPSGRMLLQRMPLATRLGSAARRGGPPPATAQLLLYDPDLHELHTVYRAMSSFTVDGGAKTVAVRVGNTVRLFPADADKSTRARLNKNEPWKAGRATGWVDVGRCRLAIDPRAEWRQMFLEAWRLMRDNFWDPERVGVDWEAVRDRYLPEVERVATHDELTDLIRCMHGELGTSHAYVSGGDRPRHTVRTVGRLAADLRWEDGAWVVERLHRGEPGDPKRSCPLLAPGVGALPGTRILAVDGQPVRPDRPVESLLVGHADRPTRFLIQRPEEERTTVVIRPLASDRLARYRSWVETNRAQVHERSSGRAGYVHIPDMGPAGLGDFFRDLRLEAERDALIVDIRYNTGGHTSPVLLRQLALRRLAYRQGRHLGLRPYPHDAVAGPLVGLINAYTASDGDIFAQAWRELGLGPLVGTRTWGGVVGIYPRTRLVDDTLVTQPEFACWFQSIGFGLEGRGVPPDEEVEIGPSSWASGADPQLDRAIALCMEALEQSPPLPPPS